MLIANAEACAERCKGPAGDRCGAGEFGLLVARDYREQRWDGYNDEPYDASVKYVQYAVPELAKSGYFVISACSL